MTERKSAPQRIPPPGAATGGPNKKRVRGTSIYYSLAEWDRVVEHARARGRTPCRYIREASLGRRPTIRYTLIRELERCSMALTRLTAAVRASDAPTAVAPIEAVLDELLAAARRIR